MYVKGDSAPMCLQHQIKNQYLRRETLQLHISCTGNNHYQAEQENKKLPLPLVFTSFRYQIS